MKDINLVNSNQAGLSSKEVRKALFISLIVFFVTFLATFAALAYNFTLTSQTNDLISEQNDLKKKLAPYSDRKIKVLLAQSSLTKIENLMKTRENPNEKIALITALVPESIDIEEIQVKGTLATFDLRSQNLAQLNTFVERVSNFNGSKVKQSKIESFSINSGDSLYDASVSFNFGK